MVLAVEPENDIVLKAKYKLLERFISYSVHETLSGVLVGFGGANKDDMPEMFKHLEEFACVSKKLGRNDGEFIKECHTYYSAWEQYLESKVVHFKDFLDQQGIDY